MMRFQQTLVALLSGAVIGVPLMTSDEELAQLEGVLSRTTRSIEVLRGVEEILARDVNQAAGLVRAATEAPMLDEHQRDVTIARLRSELGLLQMELDALELSTGLMDSAPSVEGMADMTPRLEEPAQRLAVSVGLDDELRASLRVPIETEKTALTASETPPAGPEGEGYTADPVGMARACYRAGRFQRGVDVLDDARATADVYYWRARCLERLDRMEEAQADLERVLRLSEPDSTLALRATTDLEFVRWKKDFIERLPAEALKTGGQR